MQTWFWSQLVAAVSAGPRALADICCGDPWVSEPPGPSSDRAGKARRGAGQWQEVPEGGVEISLVTSWQCNVWTLTSHPSQLSEDADAAAEDNSNSPALSQRQAYRQYVCLFSSMHCALMSVPMPKCLTPFILIFPTELAYNDEQIHKFEKWVCVHTAALWLALPCEGFCPELSRNLLVTVPSQNPPVVPHQAREVSLQRGQRAAVQRALDHNKDVEQVRATFELSEHTAGFTRTTSYSKTFVCLNKK